MRFVNSADARSTTPWADIEDITLLAPVSVFGWSTHLRDTFAFLFAFHSRTP